MSSRTAQNPMGGVIVGTTEEFLREAKDTKYGKVFNIMDIPLHGTNFPDPEGFEYVIMILHPTLLIHLRHLSTNEAALLHTWTMTGCQYSGSLPVDAHTKWGMASTAGAFTNVHCNRMARMVIMKVGAQMWYHGAGPMDTINSLKNFHPWESCMEDHSFEGTLLEAGDVMYESFAFSHSMLIFKIFRFTRPNTPQSNLTVEHSIAWGRNFHATATIPDSVFSHIHTSILDLELTNTSHEDVSVFFIQIQAYWFINFKRASEGMNHCTRFTYPL